MASAVAKSAQVLKTFVKEAVPVLRVWGRYAAVELSPPKPTDIPAVMSGINKVIQSAKTGQYKEVTVKDAFRNTLVFIEVYCWFFIGECIGKRHIVGYKI